MSEDKKPGALGLEDAMEHVKVKAPEALPVVNEVEVLDVESEDSGQDSGQDSEDEDSTADEEDA